MSNEVTGAFQLIFATLGFGKYAYDEIRDGFKAVNISVFREEFFKKYTDIPLEVSYRVASRDPANYDALWERIEQYKAEGGKMALFYENTPDTWWKNVGEKRLKIFTDDGKLRSDDGYENLRMMDNREIMVNLLMNTHGKYESDIAKRDVHMWWPRPNWSWLDVHPAAYAQPKKKIE